MSLTNLIVLCESVQKKRGVEIERMMSTVRDFPQCWRDESGGIDEAKLMSVVNFFANYVSQTLWIV